MDVATAWNGWPLPSDLLTAAIPIRTSVEKTIQTDRCLTPFTRCSTISTRWADPTALAAAAAGWAPTLRQIHLAAVPGHGPDYGHFVSKDFVHWAPMPVAIWNGLDSSVWPPGVTKYDNEAIFTGSATVVPGAGPGGQPGVVNVYPGLCNKHDWPACTTGTLLALAVPADYEGDELLTNWSKPANNPIIEGSQRDPSTSWKMSSGEWRMRTFNGIVYASASDADFLAGKFYTIGKNPDFRQCECPSFYPLPAATPGFEVDYAKVQAAGALPTHVHKTSCGGDWWQLGTYDLSAPPKTLSNFTATPGFEDAFAQVRIDPGRFYASKDSEYPTKSGGKRRINWGWAQVPPASTQTLPREITFNAAARTLQQYPIEELEALRGPAAFTSGTTTIAGGAPVGAHLPTGMLKQSEIIATFKLPKTAATFGIVVGDRPAPGPSPPGTPVGTFMKDTDMPGDDFSISHHNASFGARGCEASCNAVDKCKSWTWVAGTPCPDKAATCTSGAKTATTIPGCGNNPNRRSTLCSIDFTPSTNASAPYFTVPVSCGGTKANLRLLPGETEVEIRIFSDVTFIEAYFQRGRIAMTVDAGLADSGDYSLTSDADISLASASAYPIKDIWVTAEDVRKTPSIFP